MFNKIKNILIINNFNLKNISTFKIGGVAKYFIKCYTTKSLKQTILVCIKTKLPYKIVSGCSNILFDDNGFNGAIIQFCKNDLRKTKNLINCYSGIDMTELINFSLSYKLTGLENFIGIPCKLGGAIKNNLGAFGLEISTLLKSVTYFKLNKTITNFKKVKRKIKPNDFEYRKCNFLNKTDIIISATLKLANSNKATILKNLKYYFNKKSSSQPLDLPSLGSIFKRENNIIPAKIIDELNLKGLRIGGAEISKKHAGFIVNIDNASSQDVLELINHIKQAVKTRLNINLSTEIEYLPPD